MICCCLCECAGGGEEGVFVHVISGKIDRVLCPGET